MMCELFITYLYEDLLYPKNHIQVAKHQRIAYLKYRRKQLRYRIISIGLITFLLLSLKHVL